MTSLEIKKITQIDVRCQISKTFQFHELRRPEKTKSAYQDVNVRFYFGSIRPPMILTI